MLEHEIWRYQKAFDKRLEDIDYVAKDVQGSSATRKDLDSVQSDISKTVVFNKKKQDNLNSEFITSKKFDLISSELKTTIVEELDQKITVEKSARSRLEDTLKEEQDFLNRRVEKSIDDYRILQPSIDSINKNIQVLSRTIQSIKENIDFNADSVEFLKYQLSNLNGRITANESRHNEINKGLSGDVLLELVNEGPISIPADYLNTCEAGQAVIVASVYLKNAETGTLDWYSGPVNIVPTVTANDGDIVAPTLDPETPIFSNGKCTFTGIIDTDANVTKTWQTGDLMTFPIKIAIDDELFGFTVSSITLTINVT